LLPLLCGAPDIINIRLPSRFLGYCSTLRQKIHVLRQIAAVRRREGKMENSNGKSRASFPWTFSCVTMGLAVSVSLCFAQGNGDASQELQRVQAMQRLLGPCDSLDPKVCFDIYQRRMGEFGQAMVGAGVRIVALGDSSFLAVGVPQNQTYPAQMEAALRARGHHVTVTNVSAGTAAEVLQRLDSAVPPGTDIVILKIGEHELKFDHASPDAVSANRRAIVERLHAKGVEVYRLSDPVSLLMERGLPNLIAEHLIVEPNCSPLVACHATAAGLAIVVRRSLPAIEALVRTVEEQGACRPQCWDQLPAAH
jgi:acyl-CoA thioesterase-1